MKWKVLITAPYMQLEIDRFIDFFKNQNIEIELPEVNERLEEDDLLSIIGDYDGVISGDDKFTKKVFEEAKKLKVISKWGTGIDSIDVDAANEYDVQVYNTTDAFSHPVSDTVMALVLAFARNIVDLNKSMENGNWDKIRGHTLSEKTLGIIGLGNIGLRVARKASAFNMKILGNDIKKINNAILEEYNITKVSKKEIYQNADYISLNCDLNETTYHLLTQKEFQQMDKKPIIINTARGPIIKEEALINALNKQLINGAGLDVFEYEPLFESSPLRKMDNVILSPHNSNSSPKYWDKVHQNTLRNLLKGLKGDKVE